MGNIISSSLFGKEIKDERDDFSQEDEGYDDVRYDGPLDLDQIVLLHSLHRCRPSEEKRKFKQQTGLSDDATVSRQVKASQDNQDEADATKTYTTSVLERTEMPSVSTDEEAILTGKTKPNQKLEAFHAPSTKTFGPGKRSLTSEQVEVNSCTRDPRHGFAETQSKAAFSNLREEQTTKPLSWEIDVTDLAAPKDLKRKKSAKGVAKKVQKKDVSSTTSPEEDKYIPPMVTVTTTMLAERKVLDQRRWFCISRPQYSKSCGLSSLVSCWNFLFSTIGAGDRRPITQEEALTVLGFKPPFGEIRFGPFTGNGTLMRWFRKLNNHYGTRGKSYHMYKPVGKARTVGRTSEEALRLLKAGLHDAETTFIYHCWNHYFCPVGFEEVPKKAVDAFRGPLSEDEVDTWILVADPSRKQPGIHCFRWEDISTDLNCKSPECLNIRKLHLGVQTRKTKRVGGNLHCLMAFKRSNSQSASVSLGHLGGRLGQGNGEETGRVRGWVSRIRGLDEGLEGRGCDEAHEVSVMSGFGEMNDATHREVYDEVGMRFKMNGDEANGEMRTGGLEAGDEESRMDVGSEVGEVLHEAICPDASDEVQNRHWVVRISRGADEVNGRFHFEERTDDEDDVEDDHTDSSEE
ncbi:uncharacterized protein LOC119723518 [Patiria miniata]|uniref:Basic immunoglobulin-like variable motif-containing protein n=1 Tax=Patiria miniata TaxID=46514 RepID=A0A913ZGH5_PATMI|nr:uncharacterized protein LOC119723518 [Patiria miniata]XP_038050151.1 uncharacterized protein LOC119723518 [Patiria miniata]